LASLVIEEARKLKGVITAFFYCKYEDDQRNSFISVARGILSRLFHADESLLPYLYEKASKSGQIALSTVNLAKELLETSIRNCQKVYIIIDGIDECERDERKEIVSFFEKISTSLLPNDADSFRCMFVSQDDSFARKDFAGMVSLMITESDIRKDIRKYVSVWSEKIRHKFDLPDENRKFIEDNVTEKAEGTSMAFKLNNC